jgi:hypothetical protein
VFDISHLLFVRLLIDCLFFSNERSVYRAGSREVLAGVLRTTRYVLVFMLMGETGQDRYVFKFVLSYENNTGTILLYLLMKGAKEEGHDILSLVPFTLRLSFIC